MKKDHYVKVILDIVLPHYTEDSGRYILWKRNLERLPAEMLKELAEKVLLGVSQ